MNAEVWHLDDNASAAGVVRKLLEADGWIPCEGVGLAFKPFTSLPDFTCELGKRNKGQMPVLFLLDANLGSKNYPFGGFEAWRDIENALDRQEDNEPPRPVSVVYTRDNTALMLANALDHRRACPRILPFAESSELMQADAAAFSEYIRSGLDALARSELMRLTTSQRRAALASLRAVRSVQDFRRQPCLGISNKRFDQLFPRIAAKFGPPNRELALKEAETKLLGTGLTFSGALRQFVRFFFANDSLCRLGLNQLPAITSYGTRIGLQFPKHFASARDLLNDWYGHKSGKISHWVNQTARPNEQDEKLAQLLVYEAGLRWRDDLTGPLSHLDLNFQECAFKGMRTWQTFLTLGNADRERVLKLRAFVLTMKSEFEEKWEDSTSFENPITFKLQQALDRCRAKFSSLGILPADLNLIREEIDAERLEADQDKLIRQEVCCRVGMGWFPGRPRRCVHFLIKIGAVHFNKQRLKLRISAIPDPKRDRQSLPLVADLICRVYGGTLAVFYMSASDRIGGLVFRGPIRNIPLEDRDAATAILDTWHGQQLQDGSTYMHFGIACDDL